MENTEVNSKEYNLFDEDKEEKSIIPEISLQDIPKVEYKTYSIKASFDDIYKYLDRKHLFSNIWGYKQKDTNEKEYDELISKTVTGELNNLYKDIKSANAVDAQAVYGYFRCRSKKSSIQIYGENDQLLYTLSFPESKTKPAYTLADFILKSDDGYDVLPIMVVTLGRKPVEYCKKLFAEKDYKNYYMAHGLFTELTHSFSEYVHRIIRKDLGILDNKIDNPENIIAGNFQGKRFHFGYPLCPNIEYTRIISNMLEARKIGVTVKLNYSMNPEYSLAGFIIHNKEINKI